MYYMTVKRPLWYCPAHTDPLTSALQTHIYCHAAAPWKKKRHMDMQATHLMAMWLTCQTKKSQL